MFRNYLKITWRSIVRNKIFSFINIAGLSIGIAVCALIFLYMENELSYDKHWQNAERIVRINWEESKNGVTDAYGVTSFATGPSIKESFPEVESTVRMQQGGYKHTVSYEDKYFNEGHHFCVDTNFFDVFNFELVFGDLKTCLKEPNAVVISEAMSKRFFGASNPVGKLLKYPRGLYKVTGVLKNDNAHPSHFKPNALLVLNYSGEEIKESGNNWLWLNTYTYIKLKDFASLKDFDLKLKQWSKKVLEPALKKENIEYTIELKNKLVSDIHFDAYHKDGFFDKTNKDHIYIFGCVALFVLIIACFNYMNLSTARATKRSKEVGMRKVVGASRRQLIEQFLGESLVLSGIALIVAFFLLIFLMPLFNSIAEKNIEPIMAFGQLRFWIATLAIIIFISLIGGSYPAFYLSGFQPVNVLKGKLSLIKNGSNAGRFNLRQLLVTTQFTISIVIIIATIIVFKQLKLMKDKDLGFNQDQVIVVNLPETDSSEAGKIAVFRNDILSNPLIRKFSTTYQIIGASGNLLFRLRSEGKDSQASININGGDYDYLDLLNIKLVQGRNFSKDRPEDKNNFILNEAAVKFLKLKNPLNAELSLDEPLYGKVIGVVKDYNYRSPHTNIEPLVLVLDGMGGSSGTLALIKLSPHNIAESIDFISAKWKTVFPENPIDYFFLDEEFNTQYHKEKTMLGLFTCFACLTILISCLGLFGLASFVSEQRTREIGIRKIVGASVFQIIYLISKDFLMLVVLAIAIGSPIAYYFTNTWLQNFAYRIGLGFWVFILTGFIIIIIAFVTIASMALKAAIANPVKSLRTE